MPSGGGAKPAEEPKAGDCGGMDEDDGAEDCCCCGAEFESGTVHCGMLYPADVEDGFATDVGDELLPG